MCLQLDGSSSGLRSRRLRVRPPPSTPSTDSMLGFVDMRRKKRCCRCRKSKYIDEFGLKRSKKDGRNPSCKECHRTYTAKHYEANKAYYKAKARQRARSRVIALRAIIVEAKSSRARIATSRTRRTSWISIMCGARNCLRLARPRQKEQAWRLCLRRLRNVKWSARTATGSERTTARWPCNSMDRVQLYES